MTSSNLIKLKQMIRQKYVHENKTFVYSCCKSLLFRMIDYLMMLILLNYKKKLNHYTDRRKFSDNNIIKEPTTA